MKRMNEMFRAGKDGKRPLGVRIVAGIIVVILILAMVITMLPALAFADSDDDSDIVAITRSDNGDLPLVIDAADLLTDSEEAEIEAGLQAFRQEQDFDIVVLTVNSLGGYGVVEYADLFYERNGYGGGSDHDGILILVCPEYRDWTMITSGYGITAITDYALDEIEDEILPDLSAGYYADAFKTFADQSAYYVREARNGNIIDEYVDDYGPADTDGSGASGATDNQNGRTSYPIAANAGIAGLIGVISSWFVNGRKKAELKSVRSKSQAREYMRAGSMQLTENRDRFLYKTVNRVPIARARDNEHSSGGHFGGSTIHMSPGGSAHGGGKPGKF